MSTVVLSQTANDLRILAAEVDAAKDQLVKVINKLAAAVEVPRHEIDSAVEGAIGAGRRLRDAIGRAIERTAHPRPQWSDAVELSRVVASLADELDRLAREGNRARLQAIADELRDGTVRHRLPLKQMRLDQKRLRAIEELDGVPQDNAPSIPWPPSRVDSWVLWYASFSAEEATALHHRVTSVLPMLGEFLEDVDAATWEPPKRSEALSILGNAHEQLDCDIQVQTGPERDGDSDPLAFNLGELEDAIPGGNEPISELEIESKATVPNDHPLISKAEETPPPENRQTGEDQISRTSNGPTVGSEEWNAPNLGLSELSNHTSTDQGPPDASKTTNTLPHDNVDSRPEDVRQVVTLPNGDSQRREPTSTATSRRSEPGRPHALVRTVSTNQLSVIAVDPDETMRNDPFKHGALEGPRFSASVALSSTSSTPVKENLPKPTRRPPVNAVNRRNESIKKKRLPKSELSKPPQESSKAPTPTAVPQLAAIPISNRESSILSLEQEVKEAPTFAEEPDSSAQSIQESNLEPLSSQAADVERVPEQPPPNEPAADQRPATSEPASATSLPQHLISFHDYRDARWRDYSGKVVVAPWKNGSFPEKLINAAEQAFAEGEFAYLVLFARAAAILGVRQVPTVRDVQILLSLLGVPGAVSESNEGKTDTTSAEVSPSMAGRLTVFLQALQPTLAQPIAHDEADKLLNQAGFSNAGMKAVLLAAFKLGTHDEDPIGRLRNALREIPTKSSEEIARTITSAENNLRELLKHLWSAAGGKIERTHCREAWQEFMAKAQPVLNELLEKLDGDELRRIDSLYHEHEKIADRYNARYQDRHRMDRAVTQLVMAARAVVFARRERGRRTRALQGHGLPEFVEAYNSLRQREPLLPSDRAFADIIDRLVTGNEMPSDDICGLAQIELYRRPSILESLRLLSAPDLPTVNAFLIADPVAAAAHLIEDEPLHVETPLRDISRHLRDTHRQDLLIHVRPMSDADVKFAGYALDRAQAEANRQLVISQRELQNLQQVSHRSERHVGAAVKEAAKLLDENNVQEFKREMIAAWLVELAEFARQAIQESIPHLKESFERQNPTLDAREVFERALTEHRFAHVCAMAQGELFNDLSDDRATLWRIQAVQTFPEPRRVLQQHEATPAGKLCRVWLRGIQRDAPGDELRNAFTSFVFDSVSGSGTRAAIRETKNRESLVATDAIRRWIAKNKLNPSFVPQLTYFKEIAVITAPVPPTAETFVRQTAELATRGAENRIVLLLAPNISAQMRDSLRDELRKRASKGHAVIDDLDIVRLLNPGGQQPNLLLGILEIVLEQQPKWRYVNPFEMHEGQHTKPEMFVGRKEEASQLSTHGYFSRVFSGRRLGKSALLKHIHDAQDHAKPPSGNSLKVVYVPVVGLDGEAPVVEKIIESFAAQLHHTITTITPTATTADERLKQLVDSYLDAAPKGNVLVFLDEADMFVEEQIARYETDREKCLTWKMRTEFEAKRDSHDLPRIRFVFAGYRATHRYEGAWANWGDVLRLKPLVAEDAVRLISGPLARLGINATSEAAAIAYRCGYQPAVIVRFGQQLIDHLDNTIGPSRREAVQITPEQVSAVYQSAPVQQEIRTIVWNNFQGNRFGRIVFAALLLEFARMPPGAPLDDAPTRVLHRLRSIVPNFLAHKSPEGLALDRVARTLRDFVDRSLVREVEPATQSYQLRFPHQLNVLLQEDQESIIKREASSFDQDQPFPIEKVHALVPRGVLDDLAFATSLESECESVVMVSHWSDATESRAADIPVRLGYTVGEIFDAADTLDEDSPRLLKKHIAIRDASPETAVRVLRARSAAGEALAPPLFVGGVDLLRWSIRKGADIELASVTRLAQVQLRWWFESVRGVTFAGSDPIPEFAEKTAGIPYLVGLLDRELRKSVGFDGDSASEANVRQALASYDSVFDQHARGLGSSDSRVALDAREQELVVMLSRASEIASGPSDLLDVLITPKEFGDILPGFERWRALRAEDAICVDVLFRTGILPLDPNTNRSGVFDRLNVLPNNDPIHRIARVFERCLST